MSTKDEVNKLYNKTKYANYTLKILFSTNCLAVLVLCLEDISFDSFFIIAQIISSALYVVLKCIDDGVFLYYAEKERRMVGCKNAFNVELTDYDIEGYYNNHIGHSVIKYAVNLFESNYFSKIIASKMLTGSIIKSVIAVVIFVISMRVLSNGDVLLFIAQVAFSIYVLEETIVLILYVMRMNSIFGYAYNQLITLGIKNEKQKVILLSYCVEYEAIKAHYKVRLNTRIFNKYNDELSKEWDKIAEKIVVDKKCLSNNY